VTAGRFEGKWCEHKNVIPVKTGIQYLLPKMGKTYHVYILASKRNGTLYTGVTSDLVRRVYEHRHGQANGFAKQYGVHDLVYFESTSDAAAAIQREKQIKKWNRNWKLELIEKSNPEWRDLCQDLT
jgi:putative endonuclease